MKADAETRYAAQTAISRFAETYASRDINGPLTCFAPDTDVFMYGTGADEKRVGLAEIRAQIERGWAQTDTIPLRYDLCGS